MSRTVRVCDWREAVCGDGCGECLACKFLEMRRRHGALVRAVAKLREAELRLVQRRDGRTQQAVNIARAAVDNLLRQETTQ